MKKENHDPMYVVVDTKIHTKPLIPLQDVRSFSTELAAAIGGRSSERMATLLLYLATVWNDSLDRPKYQRNGLTWITGAKGNALSLKEATGIQCSRVTINNYVRKLEKMGLIICQSFSYGPRNRSKWITLTDGCVKLLESVGIQFRKTIRTREESA